MPLWLTFGLVQYKRQLGRSRETGNSFLCRLCGSMTSQWVTFTTVTSRRTRNLITTCTGNPFSFSHFSRKMWNICWLRLLKYKNVMLLIVISVLDCWLWKRSNLKTSHWESFGIFHWLKDSLINCENNQHINRSERCKKENLHMASVPPSADR